MQINKVVQKSMYARGNNGHVVSKVAFTNPPNSGLANVVKQCAALQKATGKPVYLVGVISSLNNPANGNKIALPLNMHLYNRVRFLVVQQALLKAGVYCINPAAPNVFMRNIKAPKGIAGACNYFNCPNSFNAVTTKQGLQRTIKNLHRANARAVKGACALVMVQWPLSLYSNGVQQELAYAIKHNPNIPIFRV